MTSTLPKRSLSVCNKYTASISVAHTTISSEHTPISSCHFGTTTRHLNTSTLPFEPEFDLRIRRKGLFD